MTKPKVELDEKGYYKEIHFLYEVLNSLKTVEEVKNFVKDILTASELKMLKRRWHIATLLALGLDIRTVAYKSKTSTQTVSKVKNILENGRGGLRLAIEKSNKLDNIETKKYLRSLSSKGSSKFVKSWFK